MRRAITMQHHGEDEQDPQRAEDLADIFPVESIPDRPDPKARQQRSKDDHSGGSESQPVVWWIHEE